MLKMRRHLNPQDPECRCNSAGVNGQIDFIIVVIIIPNFSKILSKMCMF